MTSTIYTVILSFLSISMTFAQDWQKEDVAILASFVDLEKSIHLEDNTIHVINFWATWCKPCVAELPYFEESLESTQGEKIKFTYVSLDFEKHVESKLLPFLNESKIKADVVLLSDEKYNNWIDRVDPSWSGAIPATLITLNSKKIFYEGSFHSEKEILDLIKKIKS